MKAIILVAFYFFSLSLCAPENQDNIQKALLINTNLTKEELTQLLNTEGGSTSIEEVSPDAESETESETEKIFKNLRNGKLKIKVKLELNLKDKKKAIPKLRKKVNQKMKILLKLPLFKPQFHNFLKKYLCLNIF